MRAEWSSVKWAAFFVQPQADSDNVVGASNPTHGLDGQTSIVDKADPFSTLYFSNPGKSEDLNRPDSGATHFISALDKFNELIPPDYDAVKRFSNSPGCCLGNVKGNSRRCFWRMPSENRKVVKQFLTDLAATNIVHDMSRSVAQLVTFIETAVCHWHLGALEEKVRMLSKPASLRNSARSSAASTQSEGDINAKLRTLVASSGCRITYWWRAMPAKALWYLPEYRPYQAPGSSGLPVSEWVMKEAKKPLSTYKPDETQPGYLYVYWNRASFGLLKIGYTTRDVAVRLSEWEADCQHVAEEQYRSPFLVNNVARLERLVHADLNDFRVFEPFCRGCHKCHIEWFKGVDFETVLKKIEFWTNWMMKDPYKEDGHEWLLTENAENEVEHFYAQSREPNTSAKQASVPRTPLRRRLRPRPTTRPSQDRFTPSRP